MTTQTVPRPALIRRGVAARRRFAPVARAYLALTKPRIIELLLVTTVPPMVLARHALPSAGLLAATLVGGALTAGCANTINCFLDRDIDAVMRRTARRPLAGPPGRTAPAGNPGRTDGGGAVGPARALAFGLLLGAAGTALLGLAVNWLAAGLADAAVLFYVFVYTLALKRRTAANIVIGGAAGCFPVLVGWAAVTGRIGVPALLLAAVVFLWTPPHFWALALRFRADYAAAGVPMLPVVAAPATVGRRIVGYTWLTVGASLALAPYAGPLYAGCAALAGCWFLVEAHRLHRSLRGGAGRARPLRLFHVSISYLTLLFVAVAVGALT